MPDRFTIYLRQGFHCAMFDPPPGATLHGEFLSVWLMTFARCRYLT
jgi:hypothetical protein